MWAGLEARAVTGSFGRVCGHDCQFAMDKGRPHASLGPGIPDAPAGRFVPPNGHVIPAGHHVIAAPILAGLHHEYRLEPLAA
jgi:hypothetical protein